MSETLAVAVVSLLVASVFQIAGRIRRPAISLSPDGRRYLAMAAERCAPLPFALRWLLPYMCGPSPGRWRYCTAIHMTLLVPIVTIWLSHWINDPIACMVGGIFIIGLPGIWRIHLRWPVLVDPTAMAWALISALFAFEGLWLLAVACSLVAGSAKESAPVFAAVYCWHPVVLLGLVGPLLRRCTARLCPDPEGDEEILTHPFRAGWQAHSQWWRAPKVMFAPWGICLLAPLTDDAHLLMMLVVGVVLAYGQLLVAVDTVRLYQWAAPLAILCTVAALPVWALAVGLMIHLLNPWAGEGI